jgi:TatD DNase family protein
MLVDTHCHLNLPPLCNNVAVAIERAAQVGVTRIVVPSYDTASFDAVSVLAAEYTLNPAVRLYPAFGLHPWVANETLTRDTLEQRLRNDHAVAVGEIGLDHRIENACIERQSQICRMQLELAADLSLPVMLHCRGAFEELLALLAPFCGKLRGVVHAWSRSPELAMRFIKEGMHVGLGGAISRENAKHARQSASKLPLSRLVLETDAPSIGLNGVSPDDTEPAHVELICRSLATLRGISFDKAARVTTENAVALFHLK